MKKFIGYIKILITVTSCLLLYSCTAPKAYQKIYLNDAEMELAPRKAEKFEINSQVYREGASGANSGKTGGGCGCN